MLRQLATHAVNDLANVAADALFVIAIFRKSPEQMISVPNRVGY
ncbi:hypothetical protein [Paenibacillus sp. ISL-20]|nr:hypothetical protein [Paenibacillus sp. ISL-20]